MATKDITDIQVCEAFAEMWSRRDGGESRVWADDILQRVTGQCMKVCERAMERACSHGLVDYGTWLRGGWLTDSGKRLLEENKLCVIA